MLQVIRDECLKRWKFVEGFDDNDLGSGYPAGTYVCMCVCVYPIIIALVLLVGASSLESCV